MKLELKFDGKKKILYFEKGVKNYTIYIIDNIEGFLLSYEKGYFNEEIPYKEIVNVKEILQKIRKIANELNVNPPEFIVEFLPDTSIAHCMVDKSNTVLVSLPITIQNEKIHEIEDYLIYHELMHSKETLDGRFPSIGQLEGQNDYKELLIGRLNDFANEGKLEALGKPHQPKENAIQDVYDCLEQDCYQYGNIPVDKMELFSIDVITSLCDKVWGKDLTYTQANEFLTEYEKPKS